MTPQRAPVNSVSWNEERISPKMFPGESLASKTTSMLNTLMRIGLLVLVVLLCASWALSQNNCPQGFRYVGTLSGNGSASENFDKRVTVKFPQDATLDESFQQKNVRSTNGKSGAQSSMRAQDIPKGVLVIPSGKSDDVYQQGWAVSNPGLKRVDENSRYEFGMKLFCRVATTGANPNFGECSVQAEVCYKPLH